MFWKGYLNIQLSCQTHSQIYQEPPLSLVYYAKQAVKDDALLLNCTDLSCDLFFFDWLILGSTA